MESVSAWNTSLYLLLIPILVTVDFCWYLHLCLLLLVCVQFQLGWLVGCFGLNGPLRQYCSLYRAVSQREGERGERIHESKNVQTTPTRTYCKRNRPLPCCNQNCRTPRHWKLTQHHRTTRPPLSSSLIGKPGQ